MIVKQQTFDLLDFIGELAVDAVADWFKSFRNSSKIDSVTLEGVTYVLKDLDVYTTTWIICDWLDDKIDEGATRINLIYNVKEDNPDDLVRVEINLDYGQ